MTVGKRIQQARKKAGLSQKQLGEKLGLSASMIGQWENDLRNPKQETVQRIADALKCDFYWLLWGEELSIEDKSAVRVMHALNTDDYRIERTAKLAVYYSEREHQKRGYAFSTHEAELIASFAKLNDVGQQRAVERVEELTEIPKYQRQETPPEGE